MDDMFYAVKSAAGYYWEGYNKWDKQLRKAKLFTSIKYANEVVERFGRKAPEIVKVKILEEKDAKGKWVRTRTADVDGDAISKCSKCQYPVSTFWGETDFCPGCGADMRGDV